MISISCSIDNILCDSVHSLICSVQNVYDQAVASFMNPRPVCPFCSHPLHLHDSCPRKVQIFSFQMTMRIRRVYCPHCHRTHRLLPSFVIPSFQICEQEAREILQLIHRGHPLSHFSSAIEYSSAWRFVQKLKTLFSHVFSSLESFHDLFRLSASLSERYLRILPDFGPFPLFQPVP